MERERYDRSSGAPPLLQSKWGLFASRGLELLKFVTVGGLSVALNFAIVAILTGRFGVNYVLAITACFLSVTFVSFWLNRTWTFGKRQDRGNEDITRYVSVAIAQYLFSIGACVACVQLLHVPYLIATVLVSAALSPLTFVLHRAWSFRLGWLQQHC